MAISLCFVTPCVLVRFRFYVLVQKLLVKRCCCEIPGVSFDYYWLTDLLESYHAECSKDEAAERYNAAMKYRDIAIANREDPAIWTKKSIHIASGKEEQ